MLAAPDNLITPSSITSTNCIFTHAPYTQNMQFLPMLQRLIASNSISSVNPTLDQGNREVIELLAGWLNDLGFTTEIMPLADPLVLSHINFASIIRLINVLVLVNFQ